MLLQLAIGSLLLLLGTIYAGAGYLAMDMAIDRARPWLLRAPHMPKILLLLCGSMLWALAIVTVATWVWAIALWALGVFVTFETALYFSMVAFTTLGFGDILLPQEWRLLAGMSAVNGLLMIGFLTASLVEVLREVRRLQLASE
ncbi:MAG: two pore domain potassium channel family protein [Alphaproteobacteria bacterium]|nr:MAG: two pore domain potassium channel family protein [Alphaproteobacteria bacterium]